MLILLCLISNETRNEKKKKKKKTKMGNYAPDVTVVAMKSKSL